MLEQHLITVIIPVYKVEEYLEKCVQAVCRQTYKIWRSCWWMTDRLIAVRKCVMRSHYRMIVSE